MQACERALTKVHARQKVNCVPGIASLARKNRLIATLVQHYGEGAFEMTPRSWLLPNQYWHWRVRAEAQASLFQPITLGHPLTLLPLFLRVKGGKPWLAPCFLFFLSCCHASIPTLANLR